MSINDNYNDHDPDILQMDLIVFDNEVAAETIFFDEATEKSTNKDKSGPPSLVHPSFTRSTPLMSSLM